MAKVAFLGLGVMGYPMAGHLQAKAGHEVTVYNRTAAKAEGLGRRAWRRHGGDAAEAAEGAEFVMACVGNDDDLRGVCGRGRRLSAMAGCGLRRPHHRFGEVTRSFTRRPARGVISSMRGC
jgi:3-hydroxyisobutyrate dehydrogenase